MSDYTLDDIPERFWLTDVQLCLVLGVPSFLGGGDADERAVVSRSEQAHACPRRAHG